MPLRLSSYSVSNGVLTYNLADVMESDRNIGNLPSMATVTDGVVTVDIGGAMPPGLEL